MTNTASFGTGKREGHDAGAFYGRRLFRHREHGDGHGEHGEKTEVSSEALSALSVNSVPPLRPLCPAVAIDDWADRIYHQSSESLPQIPDNSVGLAFTSPPYNVGKAYDADLSLDEYAGLLRRVAAEVHRVLVPGGRYVVNVANLGRKPYIPLHALCYQVHQAVGFLPQGEIIWRKAAGAAGSCAWGSWRSARAPRLRDVHEYLLVFGKGGYARPDKGVSDIGREEFLAATLSVWDIAPASARRIGHPAPFPLALAERVVRLFSYVGDVVLDPFCGSGTTCVAAQRLGRRWVGVDVVGEYVALAEGRVAQMPLDGCTASVR
jgi:DNA modification methylase